MIPNNQEGNLVDASLRFMQVLQETYGAEKAMDFWNALSDVIDPDLKGLTFAAMLTGNTGGDIVIRNLPKDVNKIAVIKAIRTWDKRTPGLKEAKDMFDECINHNKPIVVQVFYEKSRAARNEFRGLGCIY